MFVCNVDIKKWCLTDKWKLKKHVWLSRDYRALWFINPFQQTNLDKQNCNVVIENNMLYLFFSTDNLDKYILSRGYRGMMFYTFFSKCNSTQHEKLYKHILSRGYREICFIYTLYFSQQTILDKRVSYVIHYFHRLVLLNSIEKCSV